MRYLALFLGVVALGADDPTQHVLKEVERRYNRAETLQVGFTETYNAPNRAVRSESGTLYLRKPGRMRWDYTSPPGKFFGSDGKKVYLYVPSSNQFQNMKLKETEDMRAPLAFLLGKLNFEKEFQNIQAKPEGDATRITAEPKTGNLPYSKVEFVVSPAFEIRKLRIYNLDQSVLDFVFESEKLNPPLENGLFRFRPPAGAEVVEGG
ncbi:MAG: outer membrane lipoprotein carrier protein LolA [Acidobacteriia bacterium]|nr:outer membrane lipoprotein carrier protein LolA [Terriglobia bacterium]